MHAKAAPRYQHCKWIRTGNLKTVDDLCGLETFFISFLYSYNNNCTKEDSKAIKKDDFFQCKFSFQSDREVQQSLIKCVHNLH